MPIPLEIIFHNLDRSPTVEEAVREHAAKLERLGIRVTSCRVTIEAPHKHHQQGNLYTARIDLRHPGGETVASRAPSSHHAHEDVYVALRDAFKAVRRRLEGKPRPRRQKPLLVAD